MGADGRRGRGAGRRHLATRAAHIPHTAALGSPLVRAALDRDVGPLDVGFLVGPGVVAAAPTQGPGPLAGPEDGPSLLTPHLTLASGPELALMCMACGHRRAGIPTGQLVIPVSSPGGFAPRPRVRRSGMGLGGKSGLSCR